MMKKEIHYPIFLKCASIVEDTFWRFVYEDLSYGICPYGISLHKNYLSCYVKGKEFSYKLDALKPFDVSYGEINSLLREKAGILSDKEKIIERARVCRQRVESANKKEEWATVKKKMIRDTLLEQYILENSRRFDLDMALAKKVLSLLIVGLMFKTITAKDIHYQNGSITQIEGFNFKPNKVTLTRNILQYKSAPSAALNQNQEESPTTSKTLQSYWTLYLEGIKF